MFLVALIIEQLPKSSFSIKFTELVPSYLPNLIEIELLSASR